ncbi:2-octaprenyl-3-methyl-6-methoxy-1,4-benzoquinol hydroxylase [Raoultella planticola]|nr:2-octaprenyl-3-methyl-6-methoxy-1,4-benzoquinol hydroxylase [Raoultella planticola]
MQSVDVAIVGGGMVGLAVACGLQGSGLRVAVLEQAEPQPLNADAPPALRVSAINAASEKTAYPAGCLAGDCRPARQLLSRYGSVG